jgi:hypothetical protein
VQPDGESLLRQLILDGWVPPDLTCDASDTSHPSGALPIRVTSDKDGATDFPQPSDVERTGMQGEFGMRDSYVEYPESLEVWITLVAAHISPSLRVQLARTSQDIIPDICRTMTQCSAK